MRRFYRLSVEEYDSLLEQQGGACAICSREVEHFEGDEKVGVRLNVDHDHGTGAVRGLLCTACNSLVGALEKRMDLYLRGLDYIRTR